MVVAVDNREGSRRQLAQRFCVNVSCITRLLQPRRQTGSLDPRSRGCGNAPTLDQDGLERLRGLRKLDVTRKKVKPIAAKRLVFVDETGVTTAMTPTDGRASRGERAVAKVLRLPDLNPIEEMFSKLEESLRRAAARTKQGVHEAIGRAVKQVSAHDSLGWFQNAGLCAIHT